MSKGPFVVFGLFAAVCLIILPILAFGHEENPETGAVQIAEGDQDAKELFNNNCGACHKLAAAGSDGIVGPDLDELLVTSGINDAQQFDGIQARVHNAVSCGVSGRMPKAILLGEEAEAVSAFVAAYAGRIGEGPTVDTDEAPKPDLPSCLQGTEATADAGGDESAGDSGSRQSSESQ